MISFTGNLLLIISIILNILILILSITLNNAKTIRHVYYASCVTLITTFIIFVTAFIISDFSIQNVFMHSSTIKPLLFKIAGSWASHEGSILLWITIFASTGAISIHHINKKIVDSDVIKINYLQKIYIVTITVIQSVFSCFIYFTSNPFTSFTFTPNEGTGLNPMLQDVALAIHPPILYAGQVICVVPFIISYVILLQPNETKSSSLIQDRSKLLEIMRSFSCRI